MLYCSKVLDKDMYEITDTDDGVAEVVSMRYLREVMQTYDIKVKGVAIKKTPVGGYFLSARTVSLETDIARTKLRTMRGVELRVNGTSLVGLTILPNAVDCVIRLSDYCKDVSSSIFQDSYYGGARIVLVIDDRVLLSETCINGFTKAMKNVVFDLRECSNENAFCIYKFLISRRYLRLMPNCILGENNMFCIDNKRRLGLAATLDCMAHKDFSMEDDPNSFSFVYRYKSDMYNMISVEAMEMAEQPVELDVEDVLSRHIEGMDRSFKDAWRKPGFLTDKFIRENIGTLAATICRVTLYKKIQIRRISNYVALWGLDNNVGTSFKKIARGTFAALRGVGV